MQERMCLALVRQAQRGNIKAFEVVRDTIGEKPTDKLDITGPIAINFEDDYGAEDPNAGDTSG